MAKRKYKNEPTVVDGIRFDSGGEAARWRELQLLERAGEISELRRRVRIDLEGRDGPVTYKSGRRAHVVVDFAYVEDGVQIYDDYKGEQSPKSRLQHAVLAAQGIDVRISRAPTKRASGRLCAGYRL